jgi:broad specificity phosphatase PhoE
LRISQSYTPIDAESLESFQNRVRCALEDILRLTHTDDKLLILFSHQKVFEFLSEWLSHKKLKLQQGGACYFKYKDGEYEADIYGPSLSPESD